MWQTRVFETKNEMAQWISANDSKTQWQEIFVNNAYGVIFRHLRAI